MKYVDASAVLRILFAEPGPAIQLAAGDRVVSSALVEIEAFRAVDRERLLGHLDDAIKRKELTDLLLMLDLATIDRAVIDRAKGSFAVNVRALDAIHVATAEILMAEAEGEPLEFWTHDDRQATAALSRGLSVYGVATGGDLRHIDSMNPCASHVRMPGAGFAPDSGRRRDPCGVSRRSCAAAEPHGGSHLQGGAEDRRVT